MKPPNRLDDIAKRVRYMGQYTFDRALISEGTNLKGNIRR